MDKLHCLLKLIYLSAVLLVGSAQAIAQNMPKVSIEVNKVPVSQVFKEIERQTDYRISYNNSALKSFPDVTLKCESVPVTSVLDEIFSGKKYTYELVSGNKIVIVERQVPRSVTKTISGIVTDTEGEPLPGATLVTAGDGRGVSTDINGRFTMAEIASGQEIKVSYIGFIPTSFKVGEKDVYNLVLEPENTALEEVVVVGYGVQKKVNLTGAVSNVNVTEALGDRPLTSITAALQGAAPGLRVDNAIQGAPGEAQSLNIRGTNSINGGQPLVLVNNVPMDINMIDPQDIETVSVLKDAASSAIYGARAAFGVILITTKQGKKEMRPQISYSNNFTFSKPLELPQKASPLEEVQAYKKMGWANDTYVDGKNITQWENYILDYNRNPSKYPLGYTFDEKGNLFLMRENDIFSAMMDDHGFQQTHNAAITGGSERTSYRVGFGYVNEDGILITDKDRYRRTNFSSFLSSDITDWINASIDVRYANAHTSRVEQGARAGVWGSALYLPSYQNIDPYELNGEVYPAESSATYVLYGEPRKLRNTDLRVLGRAVITPLKGLRITGEYTYNRSTGKNSIYANKYKYVGLNFSGVMNSVENTSFSLINNSTDYNALNVFANYDFKAGRNEIGLTAGYNQEMSHYEQLYSQRTDVLLENLPSISGATGTPSTNDSYTEYAVRGAFYRINYNYDNRYLLEANGRYDGSSRFPKNNRFGFFPSFSASWRVSQEQFMRPLMPVLSNLKLRASWGSIGNQAVNENYPYIPAMNIYLTNWLVDGVKPTTLGAPPMVSASFSWEKVNTLGAALEFGMFNNRLTGTLEWYKRDTKDMLAPGMDLPWVTGATAAKQNAADLRTDGWEAEARWNDRAGRVNYYVGFNLTDSRSKITRFNNESKLLTTYYEGMRIGEIWGYVTDRYYTKDDFTADGELKAGLPKPNGAGKMNPGDILYKDLDGDGKIYSGAGTADDPGDRRVIGNTTPRYQYGIHAGMNWNGFDLSFIINGVGKRDYWRTDQLAWPNGSWGVNFKHTLDFWTEDNPEAFYPRCYSNNTVNTSYNHWTQTKYLADASFVRLQNITIAYTLPKNIVSKLYLENLRIYLTGENLKTWDHLPEGLEPDMLANGAWTYPYMRKISFGISLIL